MSSRDARHRIGATSQAGRGKDWSKSIQNNSDPERIVGQTHHANISSDSKGRSLPDVELGDAKCGGSLVRMKNTGRAMRARK
jgi:hypothetical protein